MYHSKPSTSPSTATPPMAQGGVRGCLPARAATSASAAIVRQQGERLPQALQLRLVPALFDRFAQHAAKHEDMLLRDQFLPPFLADANIADDAQLAFAPHFPFPGLARQPHPTFT